MKKQLLTLLSFIVILAGCAPTQTELTEQDKRILNLTNEELAKTLIKGRTSQDEVKKLFGEPYSVKVNEKQENTYYYRLINSKRSEDYIPFISNPKYNNKIVHLSITFEKDVIKEYELSQRSLDTRYMMAR
jgi:hypothetical protein